MVTLAAAVVAACVGAAATPMDSAATTAAPATMVRILATVSAPYSGRPLPCPAPHTQAPGDKHEARRLCLRASLRLEPPVNPPERVVTRADGSR
ncbi:hypothetical protein GCM10023259_068850 [Thermocatellispora tengchongensis]